MSPRPSYLFALAGSLVCGEAAALAGGAGDRAFVLDRETPSLTVLAMPAGTSVGSVPLTGRPAALLRTPDGSRLVVLDRGPGKDKGEAGYQATGKSSATIIDPLDLKVLARVELGNGLLGGELPMVVLSADGTRLTVLCPGYQAKNPAESLPRELVTVDLGRAEVAGRLPIERSVSDLSSDREGRTAILFSPRQDKKGASQAAELRFVDLGGPSLLAKLELKGDPRPPVASPDGGFLYLLDGGSPSNKPEKNIRGTLQVVSLSARVVTATLDAGTRPRPLVTNEKTGQVFFASDGAPAKGLKAAYGELRVLSAGQLAAKLEVAPEPSFLRLSPANDRLYIVGKLAVTVVELTDLKPHPMHLDKAKGTIAVDLDPGPAKEMALSADGKRAFVLYERSSKLLVLDLDKEQPVAIVTTGRGGVKFLKALGAVAMTAASYYSAQQAAARSGGGLFYYNVYQVGAAQTSIVVRPDGRFVYVLNTQSGDVTVVDSADGKVIDKIGGGGHGLRLFPGGKRVCVVGDDQLRLIDAVANRKAGELPTGRLVAVVPSPDEKSVLALAESAVFSLDPATGEVRGRARGFKNAVQVLFAPGPER